MCSMQSKQRCLVTYIAVSVDVVSTDTEVSVDVVSTDTEVSVDVVSK